MATDGEQSVFERYIGKEWGDVESIEAMGRMLFPASIKKRRADGSFEEKPVLLMPLREHENRRARIMARHWAEKESLDPKLDPTVFENMDAICQLWLASRNPKPMRGPDGDVHEPFAGSAEELEKSYDKASLFELYDRLKNYERLLEPQKELEEGEVLAAAKAISDRRDISPLAVFDQVSQTSCIVSMAELLTSYAEQRSSSGSSGSSTAGA